MGPASEKRIGRPRDERARRSVLATVRVLLRAGGLCGLTMEGIAREAGVGKVTIYRWWPSVAAVTLEALLEEAGETCPIPDTGDFAMDLGTFLRGTFAKVQSGSGCLLRCLMAEAQKDLAFREQFREKFIRQRQQALVAILRRGKADPKQSILIVDIVFGALWYRLLVGHAPLDDALADELCEATLTLLGERQKR